MKFLLILLSIVVLLGCDSSKLSETPMSQFKGKWKIIDRPIWKDCIVEIDKDFTGRLITSNNNKYVELFADSAQVIISSIKRKSNFEFFVSEKRLPQSYFLLMVRVPQVS